MKVDSSDARKPKNNPDSKATTKKLATGPQTEVGKRRSSRNAIRHGMFAKSLIEGESRAGFCAIVRALRDDLGIAGATGEILVEKLAFSFWRQARHYRAEREESLRVAQLNQRLLKEAFHICDSLDVKSSRDCQADISTTGASQAYSNEATLISPHQLAYFITHERHLGCEIDRIFDQLERVRHFKRLASARPRSRKSS